MALEMLLSSAMKGQSSLANRSQMNETFEGVLNYLK